MSIIEKLEAAFTITLQYVFLHRYWYILDTLDLNSTPPQILNKYWYILDTQDMTSSKGIG